MRIRSFATALLGLSLTFVSAGAVVGLAIAKERASAPEILTADSCPPDSCTVVLKTTVGGPPSEVIPAAATEATTPQPASGGWAAASREAAGQGRDRIE